MELRHQLTLILLNFSFALVLTAEHVFVKEASAMKNLVFTSLWVCGQVVIFGGAHLWERRQARVRIK